MPERTQQLSDTATYRLGGPGPVVGGWDVGCGSVGINKHTTANARRSDWQGDQNRYVYHSSSSTIGGAAAVSGGINHPRPDQDTHPPPTLGHLRRNPKTPRPMEDMVSPQPGWLFPPSLVSPRPWAPLLQPVMVGSDPVRNPPAVTITPPHPTATPAQPSNTILSPSISSTPWFIQLS